MQQVRNFWMCRRGTAAVEFAIVAPVMLFLLFGLTAYGVFFGAAHSVQQLAANSARAAMGGYDLEERQSLVEAYVTNSVSGAGLLVPDKLDVTVQSVDGNDSLLQVIISYDASNLPIWNLYSGLPLPEKTIRRDAVIRSGGY